MKILISIFILLSNTSYANSFYNNSLYFNQCATCHGAGGEGQAGFSPRLSGQHWQYLKDQMLDIKNGKRTNGKSYLMRGIFNKLTTQQIEDISKYLQELK